MIKYDRSVISKKKKKNAFNGLIELTIPTYASSFFIKFFFLLRFLFSAFPNWVTVSEY